MSEPASFVQARINVAFDAEVARWARVLDASPEEVRAAVRRAGPELNAVRSFLQARQLGLFDLPLTGLGAGIAQTLSP